MTHPLTEKELAEMKAWARKSKSSSDVNCLITALRERNRMLEGAIRKAVEDLPHRPHDAEYRLEAALAGEHMHVAGGEKK